MTYIAENCTGTVSPVIYEFNHWMFLKEKT